PTLFRSAKSRRNLRPLPLDASPREVGAFAEPGRPSLRRMEAYLESGSYLAVVLALIGGALGLPLPEEAVLLTAGALAGRGITRWWIALPVGGAAVLVL